MTEQFIPKASIEALMTEEMAQWVKFLLIKCGDLTADLQYLYKRAGHGGLNPSSRDIRQKDPGAC